MKNDQWSIPPDELSLLPDEIHLWLIDLIFNIAVLVGLVNTLSEEEIAHANRYRLSTDRDGYRYTHAALREILSRYGSLSAKEIAFSKDQYGKPTLATGIPAVEFNLSSSANYALVAVSAAAPVGVDIEKIQPLAEIPDMIRRNFSPSEIQAFEQLPPDKMLDSFYTLWTAKEAYVKARGRGISIPFDQFSVSHPVSSFFLGDPVSIQGEGSENWWIFPIPILDEYKISVATRIRKPVFRYWLWKKAQVSQ